MNPMEVKKARDRAAAQVVPGTYKPGFTIAYCIALADYIKYTDMEIAQIRVDLGWDA